MLIFVSLALLKKKFAKRAATSVPRGAYSLAEEISDQNDIHAWRIDYSVFQRPIE